MTLDDIIDLATAAEDLGLAPVTMRAAVSRGRLDARKVGNTWITTRQEVERYRREHLGAVGRPREAREIARIPWAKHPDARGFVRILGFDETPANELEAVTALTRQAIKAGATSVHQVIARARTDDRTRDLILSSGELPPWIGIGRVVPHGEIDD